MLELVYICIVIARFEIQIILRTASLCLLDPILIVIAPDDGY
ncbi:hypothetical protein SP41_84 [Salmonella phage 41]|nr:hypothetical protein SP41_84 [Salmonella phage 41]